VLFIIIPSDKVSKTNAVVLVPPVKFVVVEPDITKYEFPVNPLEAVEVYNKFGEELLELINCKEAL
jgi:hypothetical protein